MNICPKNCHNGFIFQMMLGFNVAYSVVSVPSIIASLGWAHVWLFAAWEWADSRNHWVLCPIVIDCGSLDGGEKVTDGWLWLGCRIGIGFSLHFHSSGNVLRSMFCAFWTLWRTSEWKETGKSSCPFLNSSGHLQSLKNLQPSSMMVHVRWLHTSSSNSSSMAMIVKTQGNFKYLSWLCNNCIDLQREQTVEHR